MESSDPAITIKPSEPTGNFNWYITPVNVSFYTSDPPPSSGLDYIKYRIITEGENENPDWITYDITEYCTWYNLTITLTNDGKHIMEFYAADNVGNIGSVHNSEEIKIDRTHPEIALTKEKTSLLAVQFTAEVQDTVSGIYTVQFYVDGELAYEKTSEPYEYLWQGFQNQTVTATAFDHAGNQASTEMGTPIFKRVLIDFLLGGIEKYLPL
jgi:hypothetical protein